jgi:hypothetical protein
MSCTKLGEEMRQEDAPTIIAGLRRAGSVIVPGAHFHPDVRAALRNEFGVDGYISYQDWGAMPYNREARVRIIALKSSIERQAVKF